MVLPCMRWPGSKMRLADEIVALLGDHETYIEPYFGSGAVLLAKPRSKVEVINDLDGEVINFYRMLRTRTDDLVAMCALTPCAEDELAAARQPDERDDDLERARKFFVRANQAHAGASNGGWIPKYKAMNTIAEQWVRAIGRLGPVAERLMEVQVCNRDAIGVLRKASGLDRAAVYLDPPYLMKTVTKGNHYVERSGLSLAHHEEMLGIARDLDATVVVSHYSHELYEDMLSGWERHVRSADHMGNPKLKERQFRSEVLWVNRPATGRLF